MVRLRQVLLNVAGNAIKFTDCGEVRLDVHFDAGVPHALVISVMDTGIGMPLSALQHIFVRIILRCRSSR